MEGSGQSQAAQAGPCILVADDDAPVRKYLCDLLQTSGYRVVAVKDGVQAVDYLDQNPRSVDLVILDVLLPNLGGRRACERLRQRGNSTPVLFSSGFRGHAEDVRILIESGEKVIEKPYDSGELISAIKESLAQSFGPGVPAQI